MIRVLVGQPCYSGIEPESYTAAQNPTQRRGDVQVSVMRPRASLLAHAFNLAVVYALNEKYDYFGLLHGDVLPDKWWIDSLLDAKESSGVEVVHAISPIKDDRGLTSTALGYSDDAFAPVRRLTVTELQGLPDVFTIADINERLDPDATHLLPNTGCILMRANTWLRGFTGFTIDDRIIRGDGEWGLDVCPEDWNFGHWCAKNGVSVGASKMRIRHVGHHTYDSSHVWGQATDEHYQEARKQYEEYCNAI